MCYRQLCFKCIDFAIHAVLVFHVAETKYQYPKLKKDRFVSAHSLQRVQGIFSWLQGRLAWPKSIMKKQFTAGRSQQAAEAASEDSSPFLSLILYPIFIPLGQRQSHPERLGIPISHTQNYAKPITGLIYYHTLLFQSLTCHLMRLSGEFSYKL